MSTHSIRHNWQVSEVLDLFNQPFFDLLHQAHTVHRQNFDAKAVQLSTLLSIKTGACPEDCAYCPQSIHYNTTVEKEALMPVEKILEVAKKAKAAGATRFCCGSAWRKPTNRQIESITEIVKAIKAEGLETCMTLGMLTPEQATTLKQSGLDYYNHNLDSSPEYYAKIITTRTYQDRLDTLDNIRKVGLKTCCGGIIGMGETRDDRAGLLVQLANLPEHPESVPINQLAPVEGTPLAQTELLDPFEFIRTIAIARIMLSRSVVRLSAGRDKMSDEMQALCFYAGANSIFYGEEKLLTTGNPDVTRDQSLLQRLGMKSFIPHDVDSVTA